MLKLSCRFALAALFVVIGIRFVTNNVAVPRAEAADAPQTAKATPVETDMHEFMEYYFQPTYKRLKVTMAAEPADKAGWRGIKADALILAEGGNLLLGHTPETDGPAWNELSVAVRNTGVEFYKAGKARDFASARKHYETLLKNCNACHDKFADGEHQLTP